GTLTGRAMLDLAGQPLGGTVRLELSVANPRFAGAGGTEVSAKQASLKDVRVDLSARSIHPRAGTGGGPVLVAALTARGDALPIPAGGDSGGQAWTVRSGPMQARGGRIAARRGDAALALQLDSLRWDGLRPGRHSAFAATARAETGGSIAVEGTV